MPTPGITQFDPTNPSTPDDSQSIPSPTNNALTVLAGKLLADTNGNTTPTTSLNVEDASGFPDSGWISVGDEVILYNGKSGNSLLNIVRASQGSQSASHPDKGLVVYNMTALHLQVIIDALINLQLVQTRKKFDQGVTAGGNITLTAVPVTGQKVILLVGPTAQHEGTDFNMVGAIADFGGGPPPAGLAYTAIYTGTT